MSAIKAKFTKNFNGDSEVNPLGVNNPMFGYCRLEEMPADSNANMYNVEHVELTTEKSIDNGDYTNFDNAVYELDENGHPNFDSSNVTANRSTSKLDSLFGGKGENKRRWLIIGGVAIIVVLAVIIIAAAVGSTVVKQKEQKEQAMAAAASESKGASSFYGSLRITNRRWSDEYSDPSSLQYQQLEVDFLDGMVKVLKSEDIDGQYSGTRMLSLSPGSIIVGYLIRFAGPKLSMNVVQDKMISHVVNNGGSFGIFVVDPSSMFMDKDPANIIHNKPANTTTAAETTADFTQFTGAKVTPPSSNATTSVDVKATSTPLIVESCGNAIIQECRSVLPYTTSIRPIGEQRRMKQLLGIAEHTQGCYNESTYYMCSVIAPHCASSQFNNSVRAVKEFLLPCRQLCLDYLNQCKEELLGVDTHQSLICNQYLPYVPEYPNICSYQGTPPAPLPTSTPTNTDTYSELCYPIHHSYCSNIPWKAAYLPNYLGHTTLSEAYDFLSFMQALQDSGMHCHEELHTLVCGTLLPKCGSDYTRVPPCRSLCLDVLANCTLMLSNLPVPIPLSCSLFTTNENCTNVGDLDLSSDCAASQYTCLNGQQCIDVDERCDGFPDCSDGSDERGCVNNTTCHPGQFKCAVTGACIPENWKCDSYNDCGDSTDEAMCNCEASQFQCSASDGTMRCINASQECDGYYNCFGRQDEMNCSNFTCREDQFTCNNGLCRPLRFVCDGDDDCGDLSDEHDCLRNEVCLASEFKCVNGSRHWGIGYTSCVPKSWQCDTERDCSDGSDEKHCPSYCFPNPCSHGGNCTADVRGYLCECPAGTGGSNCQIVENLPDISCDTPISIDVCKAPLRNFHSDTISSPLSQSQVAPFIEAGISRFESCYEYSAEFLCQYVAPQCGSMVFPVFPCKSMCREFRAQCEHELNSTSSVDRLIDCDSLLDDYLYPDSECFKLGSSNTTVAPAPEVPEAGCQELKVDYCMDLGYNTTFFPNYFNQTHQAAAQWLVEQFEHAHSNMPTCNPYLKHFGCAVAVPPCNADGTAAIPPCRELCEAVAFDCGYWMDHMQWRFPFTCAALPYANSTAPSTCIPLPPAVPKQGCYGDQFECGSGECIHKTFQCDSFPDCDDGSDEDVNTCGISGCTQTEFDCGNDKCIPLAWVCDADNDCPISGVDHIAADEGNCVCEADEMQCLNGVGCIPKSYQCDGFADCKDKSDESTTLCANKTKTCEEGLFQCDNGDCTPAPWKCDGFPDCSDRSDEINCHVTCKDSETSCTNGVNIHTGEYCLPVNWLCDHEMDCSDGSDEEGCVTCTPTTCQHGGKCVQTVDRKLVCDCPDLTTGTHCEFLLMPSVQCEQTIAVPQCQRMVGKNYNHTRVQPAAQKAVSSLLSHPVSSRIVECAPHISLLVLCAAAIPGCQVSGLPIVPCKHLCTSFVHECAGELNSMDIDLDCDLYPDKSVYPDTICISSPAALLPPPHHPINQPQCQQMKHEFCASLYSHTVIPNLIGQNSQGEAAVYVDILQTIVSKYPLCHDALKLYTCSVFAPQCKNGEAVSMLPCRELCIEVQLSCSYELSILGLPLEYDCTELAAYNNDVSDPNCVIHRTQLPVCAADTFECYSGACIPSDKVCDGSTHCPDGSDEISCPPVTCGGNKFLCSGSGDCIPGSWQCDGEVDCLRGEDEHDCVTVCNDKGRDYRCKDNRTCLALAKLCDYITDCPDGDDEEGCGQKLCTDEEFRCDSGKCIPKDWTCDGVGDCPAQRREDELSCSNEGKPCQSDEYQCTNGHNIFEPTNVCIPAAWLCDSERDCTDGSDETNPKCRKTETTTLPVACDVNQCLNGGTCVMASNTPTCLCNSGYTGATCDTEELEDYACNHTIDMESTCIRYLPYTTTSTPVHVQHLLHHSTESLLYALTNSKCYDLAEMFVCSLRYPTCQINGFPLLPCRQICDEFKSHCNHLIEDGRHSDLQQLNCSLFVAQASSTFTCLSSEFELPSLQQQADVEPHCEALHHPICSSMGYDLVSLPNHFGQTTQAEASYLVNLLTTLHSTQECRRVMTPVACGLTFPKCATDDKPLPVCQTACADSVAKCKFFLDHYQFKLPVNCDSFPDSRDPTVCLQPVPVENLLTQPCADSTRLCVQSGECINENRWCNTEVDCMDAADEEHCDVTNCPSTTFRCESSYSSCIPKHWRCDGYLDCPTGSDEMGCTKECSKDKFLCPYGSVTGETCIPLSWRCDGETDCTGIYGEDEKDCDCSAAQFKCLSSGHCITREWVCDSSPDCEDKSDEIGCSTTSVSP